MKKIFVRYIAITLISLVAYGCRDDFMEYETIGDGKAVISATMDFKPMSTALAKTRAAGDALKEINSLSVLLYDYKTKELKKSWNLGELKGYTTSDELRSDADAEDGTSAETKTKHATFKLPEEIDFGRYYMYAVANISDLLTNEAYSESIKTVDGLKAILLTWNSENISANGQMMGYFTNESSQSSDESLTVKERSVKLHAWLRRAASKVTVAFDASKLNDGIRIYLKSVKIKDIPKSCPLGRDNTPGYTSATFEQENGKKRQEELHEDGETLFYTGKVDDFDNDRFESWPFVSRGKPVYGLLPPGQSETVSPKVADYHTEDTPALYFYENLQGDEKSRPGIKDKRQDANGDKVLDAPGMPGDGTYRRKDGVEFGTYIEVEGYYDARLSNRPGEGRIIYRFMLGQDVIKDYNARRNFHYKITLVLNGYANDVDWHIEYEEDKEMIVSDPSYISYLYNQTARLPIRLKGSNMESAKLEVRIIENHWWPTLERPDDPYRYADTTKVYPVGHVRTAVWNGFLSLAPDNRKIIAQDDDGSFYKNKPNMNREEWRTEDGLKTFENLTVGDYDDYSVTEAEGGGINLILPLYTRPKQLVTSTGYTGNNPYVAYTREAKLQLRLIDKATNQVCRDKDGKEVIDTVSVFQVRRCVNPKGVWRNWNNKESFHVVMKILPYDSAEKFETYTSKGAWRAKVEIDDDNMIRIREAEGDGYVYGHTDTPMDFHIDFNSTCADSQTTRCAIILVEYNNYSCHHRIFVRQGYAPLVLNDRKIKWHSFNLYSSTEETRSPLEEGSLFKYGNLNDAILAENNKTYGFQAPLNDNTLSLAGGGVKLWNNIPSTDESANSPGFSNSDIRVDDVTDPGRKVKVRVASAKDYENLRNEENREFGYGVLYGDGATETLEDINEVYGYYRDGDRSYGMRGCFVYNKVNGNNLFFPIGASGYGRRRTDKLWYGAENKNPGGPGSLQYAWRGQKYSDYASGWSSLTYRPLFENVYMRPGAVYWCDRYIDGKSFLDINYFTFDFNTGSYETLEGNTSSACFIRCVEDVD